MGTKLDSFRARTKLRDRLKSLYEYIRSEIRQERFITGEVISNYKTHHKWRVFRQVLNGVFKE